MSVQGWVGIGDQFRAIGRGLAEVVERNRDQFPWNSTRADWAQVEQDMQDEICDMGESYERIWGRPRPTGR